MDSEPNAYELNGQDEWIPAKALNRPRHWAWLQRIVDWFRR